MTPALELRFFALGKPEPQGSAKAFLPKGWTRPVVTSDNAKNKGWRRTVALAALDALGPGPRPAFSAGVPVRLELAFRLPRPKTLKGVGVLHRTRPDLDKLVRSVCDALTGIAWADDGQVADLSASKAYADTGEAPGVTVTVKGGTGATALMGNSVTAARRLI